MADWGRGMEQNMLPYFVVLREGNQHEQFQAFQYIKSLLHEPVDWTYSVWGQLVHNLTASNVYTRSYSAQLLCALAAKSDPEERVLNDFVAIWHVTFDKPFEIARRSLQVIWQIGIAGKVQQELVMAYLVNRYVNCVTEPHSTTIRLDIMESLHKLFKATGDQRIEEIARSLMEREMNMKK